jgi:5-dehydro-2-deoxygluconokinase
MLEIIPPKGMPVDDRTISRSLEQIYSLGVHPEWWKLPSQSRAGWRNIDAVIDGNDRYCRGIVVLGLDAPVADLANGFKLSTASKHCKGFAVGRTIFGIPARRWLAEEVTDEKFVEAVSKNYTNLVRLWRARVDTVQ